MSINLKTRGLVFATFFGSCMIIGLLVAALTTEYWIESEARHKKVPEGKGHLKFGLFSGSKNLNIKFGDRFNTTDVHSLIRDDVLQYTWWILTSLGVGFGLLSSFIAGIASVCRAASASKKRGTMVILFVSNISSLGAQATALIAWGIQFYKSLFDNVLLIDDVNQGWHTKGLARFGISFYFVVIGSVIALFNIILLIWAVSVERRQMRRYNSGDNDENKGAIMLY
uniref:CSON007483 protein n=1 Tax=Culicoides sonorensis TaxID=179676 RepID=A0A336N0D0_CULSO